MKETKNFQNLYNIQNVNPKYEDDYYVDYVSINSEKLKKEYLEQKSNQKKKHNI
jgi:hypothetical protein